MAFNTPTRQESRFQLNGLAIFTLLDAERQWARDHPNRTTTLYTHQIEAALKTKAWFEQDSNRQSPKPALIVAPTGSAKTGIVALLPYVLKCPRVIILSPSHRISEQLAQAFGKYEHDKTIYSKTNLIPTEMVKDFIEPVNIVRQGREVDGMGAARLVIINVHEVSGAIVSSEMCLTNKEVVDNVHAKFAPFTTIIVYEANHFSHATWAAIIKICKGKQLIFLTPFRKDMDGNRIDGLDQENTYQILVENIAGVSIRHVKSRAIEGIEKDKVDNFDDNDVTILKDRILACLTQHDRQVPGVSHKAMILVWGMETARKLATKLGQVATYHTSNDRRNVNLARFEDRDENECKILVVCGKLTAGYQNSDVSVCVILRKVQSAAVLTEFIVQCRRLSSPGDPVKAVILYGPRV